MPGPPRSYPLAYLLTWTCYGTWLPGAERGSTDLDHNAPGTGRRPPDRNLEAACRAAMAGPAARLDARDRRCVRETVLAHARFRGWTVSALSVKQTHVHVVVDCAELHPRRAMEQLKAWTTRRLRESGAFDPSADVWTEGGSARWLWDERSMRAAVDYVTEGQGPED